MAFLGRLKNIHIPNPLASWAKDSAVGTRRDYFEYYVTHRFDLSSGTSELAITKIRKAQELGLTPEDQQAVYERLSLPIACRR